MKEGKIFYLLKNLTQEEFKGLKKVIQSPFFNTNKRIYTLYNALQVKFPEYEDSEKYRRRLYKKVYPNEAFNIDKQHQLFSAFCRIVEDYMLILNNRADKLEYRKQKIRLYAKRQMKPYFNKEIKALTRELEASAQQDLEHYETQIFLNTVRYFNPNHNKYDLKDTALDDLVDALDRYFALAKMRFGISVKSRERILAKPGVWRFTKAIEEETGFMKESVIFQIYEHAFLMLEEVENFDFDKYEKLLFENIDNLRTDAKILFVAGLNYVNRQINRGISPFSSVALKWYRFGLEQSLLFEKQQISDVIFSNIVVLGCREREYEWTQSFIREFAVYLDANKREEIVSFNQGMFHFYKKEFRKVYTIWHNYPFSFKYAHRAKLTAIRALFELFLGDYDYYEVLIYNIKAYETFIFRDRKYAYNKWEPHLNCIRVIKKAATLLKGNKAPKAVREKLADELNKYGRINSKTWLENKIIQIGQ